MDFSFAKIPDELIRAICTTLIHSLGQGLLLAAFAGVIILFTRKASPGFRYKLLIGGLLIFCCAITFTFFYQLDKENTSKVSLYTAQQLALHTNPPLLPRLNVAENDSQLLGFLTNHSNTIVLIWFLIVLARTIQLLTGLNSLYALRRKAIFTLGADVEQMVAKLTSKMGIKHCIRIAESALVKVPMVIGHLKPLILIPVGLLTALPPTAIEAILVHELAHISRRDYLVNLIISLIEVIFFFNPAVLWLASLIREEREHCCDDIVVAQTSNKTDYIRALIACQEYYSPIPAFAMPLSGHKNHLLGRVKRILSKNNQSLNVIEKSMLSICVVIAGLLIVAFSNADKINKLVNTASHQMMQTSKEFVSKIENKKREQEEAVTQHRTLLSISNINSTEVDTPKCETYLPNQIDAQTTGLLINVDLQTLVLNQNVVLYPTNSTAEHVGSLDLNGPKIPVMQQQKYMAIRDSLKNKKRTLTKLNAVKGKLDYLRARLDYQTDSARKYATVSDGYRTRKTGYEIQLPAESPEIPEPGPAPVSMKTSTTLAVSDQLAKAILNDGLVSNLKSYKLTENELIINGKRISKDAFQSFKDKNIQSIQKGGAVYYKYDTSTVIN